MNKQPRKTSKKPFPKPSKPVSKKESGSEKDTEHILMSKMGDSLVIAAEALAELEDKYQVSGRATERTQGMKISFILKSPDGMRFLFGILD